MGAKVSKFEVLEDKELKDQITEPHTKHIQSLNSKDFYTLQQYTLNGDILLNSFLRGMDTIELYRDMLINYPESVIYQLEQWNEYKNTSVGSHVSIPRFYFFPLFLFGYTEEPKQIKNAEDEVIRIQQRIAFYKENIQHILQTNKDKLAFFRSLIYRFFQQFITIAQTFPLTQVKKPFIVYRGVKKVFYSLDKTKVNILPSFESTSLDYKVAYNFMGPLGTQLIYIVAPECQYMYLQAVSRIHPPEKEILLLPGHRYCYIDTTKLGSHIFAILPPNEESLDLVMNSISKTIPKNLPSQKPKSKLNTVPLPSNTNNNTNTKEFNNTKYIGNVSKWTMNQEGKGRKTRRRQRGGAKGGVYENRWTMGHENVIIRKKTKEEIEYLEYLKSMYVS